ncbi:hypothetical protein [Lyngbya sp. PCC 8106]|uniref:hypothetical protein n=1 Tax=Lyngbya sp. (strain PCC 8106) TaxID=313612 RepID=UPI0000EA8F6D|nr:hypothetical protein [Lyngbya sp. PCC 8106]EAW35109.1 hypothetical protein L8106_27524 [Lyngbya sp. PCC 8106]
MSNFLNKKAACALLSVSSSTLKRYQKKYWLEGIHFIRVNSRNTRYNERLIKDWIENRYNSKAHQQTIEHYQLSLQNAQKKQKAKK